MGLVRARALRVSVAVLALLASPAGVSPAPAVQAASAPAASGPAASAPAALAASLAQRAAPAADERLRRPSRGGVLSGYGMRVHPYTRVYKLHTGIDFSAGDGRARAALPGRVVSARWQGAYGNTVVVDHGRLRGQRIQTLYAHLAGFRVRAGQRVSKGKTLGIIGSTGHSTWRHLHFEVRINGKPVNPRNWLNI